MVQMAFCDLSQIGYPVFPCRFFSLKCGECFPLAYLILTYVGCVLFLDRMLYFLEVVCIRHLYLREYAVLRCNTVLVPSCTLSIHMFAGSH